MTSSVHQRSPFPAHPSETLPETYSLGHVWAGSILPVGLHSQLITFVFITQWVLLSTQAENSQWSTCFKIQRCSVSSLPFPSGTSHGALIPVAHSLCVKARSCRQDISSSFSVDVFPCNSHNDTMKWEGSHFMYRTTEAHLEKVPTNRKSLCSFCYTAECETVWARARQRLS